MTLNLRNSLFLYHHFVTPTRQLNLNVLSQYGSYNV